MIVKSMKVSEICFFSILFVTGRAKNHSFDIGDIYMCSCVHTRM